MVEAQRVGLPQHGLSSREVDLLWYLFHYIVVSGWISGRDKKNSAAILEGSRKHLEFSISGKFPGPFDRQRLEILNGPNVKLETLVEDVYFKQRRRLTIKCESTPVY